MVAIVSRVRIIVFFLYSPILSFKIDGCLLFSLKIAKNAHFKLPISTIFLLISHPQYLRISSKLIGLKKFNRIRRSRIYFELHYAPWDGDYFSSDCYLLSRLALHFELSFHSSCIYARNCWISRSHFCLYFSWRSSSHVLRCSLGVHGP